MSTEPTPSAPTGRRTISPAVRLAVGQRAGAGDWKRLWTWAPVAACLLWIVYILLSVGGDYQLDARYTCTSDPSLFITFRPDGVAWSNLRSGGAPEECRWRVFTEEGDLRIFSENGAVSFSWYAWPAEPDPFSGRHLLLQNSDDMTKLMKFTRDE